jgi:hypothetical protein
MRSSKWIRPILVLFRPPSLSTSRPARSREGSTRLFDRNDSFCDTVSIAGCLCASNMSILYSNNQTFTTLMSLNRCECASLALQRTTDRQAREPADVITKIAQASRVSFEQGLPYAQVPAIVCVLLQQSSRYPAATLQHNLIEVL